MIELFDNQFQKFIVYFNFSNKGTFIKVYLLYNGHRVEKKQTAIILNTSDPLFNETFEYDLNNLAVQTSSLNEQDALNQADLADRNEFLVKVMPRLHLYFMIMDWDPIEKSDVIGKIELPPQLSYHSLTATKPQVERKLNVQPNWYDIFLQPNAPILCTYQIQNF